MEQDKVVRKNLAYVGAVTKIAKAAIKASKTMGKGLFTKETVDRYAGTVERDTGEERI